MPGSSVDWHAAAFFLRLEIGQSCQRRRSRTRKEREYFSPKLDSFCLQPLADPRNALPAIECVIGLSVN